VRDNDNLPGHQRTGDEDLSDLLQELRVLLPGTQTLTAFLIILPFNSGFADIQSGEKYVYLATFLCSVTSLILFAAPAAQHRLQRPLRDREAFKHRASQLVVAGLIPLSLALVLATQLVLDEVLLQAWPAWVAAGLVALLIAIVWWLTPLRIKARRDS
jgi:drug/metabolite transporter (DMT)-like permease